MSMKMILEYFEKQPEGSIFIARELYMGQFNEMTETAFLKALERINQQGILIRLSKGIYCKPRRTQFGTIAAGERDLTSYFTGKNHRYGFVIGYRLYNKYRLTTQISKTVEVYSQKSPVIEGNIQYIRLRKLESFYHSDMRPMIEFLEILEHYRDIEDLNRKSFLRYCSAAVKEFNENIFEDVYPKMGYKKRTIAFLKEILDTYGVHNTLKKYLCGSSKYQIPQWRGHYGTL